MSPLAINGLVLALTAGLSFGSAALRPPPPAAPAVEPCRSVAACTFSTASTSLSSNPSQTVAQNLQTVTLSLSKRASHAPVVPYAGDTDRAGVSRTRPGAALALTDPQPAYGLFRADRRPRRTNESVLTARAQAVRTANGGFPDF